jgi:ATP adenylyltransferase
MDHLWSPWRLSYVLGEKPGEKPGEKAPGVKIDSGCVFCNAVQPDPDPLVLFQGAHAYVILNLYPYNNGHLMVVPYKHVDTLTGLDQAALHELADLTQRSEIALREAYHLEGMNIGVNLGRVAGAGIVEHLHVHLVPRWLGDTNFMPIIGQTRVLPEDLASTAKRLRPIFQRLSAG